MKKDKFLKHYHFKQEKKKKEKIQKAQAIEKMGKLWTLNNYYGKR